MRCNCFFGSYILAINGRGVASVVCSLVVECGIKLVQTSTKVITSICFITASAFDFVASFVAEQTTEVCTLWVIIGIDGCWAQETIFFTYFSSILETCSRHVHTPCESFTTWENRCINHIFITIYCYIFVISYHIILLAIVENNLHTCSRRIEPPTESNLGAICIHLMV